MVKRNKRVHQVASFVASLVTTRIDAGTSIQKKDPNGQNPRTKPRLPPHQQKLNQQCTLGFPGKSSNIRILSLLGWTGT
jgi:hypothetical protein